MQQFGYGFLFPADQGDARFLTICRQCRATDRRDFTDGDLTVG